MSHVPARQCRATNCPLHEVAAMGMPPRRASPASCPASALRSAPSTPLALRPLAKESEKFTT